MASKEADSRFAFEHGHPANLGKSVALRRIEHIDCAIAGRALHHFHLVDPQRRRVSVRKRPDKHSTYFDFLLLGTSEFTYDLGNQIQLQLYCIW